MTPLVVLTPDELRDLIRAVVGEALAAQRPSDGTPALLDRAQLAERLGVCVATVDRGVRRGLPFLLVGDVKRFDLAKVLTWLESDTAKSRLGEPAAKGSK